MSSFSSKDPKYFSEGLLSIWSQDFALSLVGPHEIGTGPILKPVQIPQDDIPSLQSVNCSTGLGVICKLAEGTLDLMSMLLTKFLNSTRPKSDSEEHHSSMVFNTEPLTATH